ncbi:MAG: 50S ribosomal protein L23 [Sulfobacillus thermosulfidooxidans]|uniref:Large ribosomal subunit protein uL23 n=1 Tax=Sulfobacillus thermotolerans TaxID=338644 RepID=A0ABN5GX85_9FIRM|nr:50S ribosomal protein L23 [Sulfobacillus sp. hq2]AUW92941.1 50S ribosomal protein L23 [Sulfobacillus thermotolerans]MCY0907136.1 50S ribosomal protein L23 [Sulfobacillus thermotolerans]POB11196.1 50S ribosomal protein L23 [Sulfobacillus sp. hq2]PSR37237.1 MAG: 50S ribosomal protein L23 [Sulfobacillus thermosulfidooxidans]
MKTAYDIVLRPLVTEAATDRMAQNKYTFEVAPSANKVEIRYAIEEIFKVHVTKVNTLWRPSKEKRRGNVVGHTTRRKKAIVTLAPGDTIDIFEGV